ncbi:hypothetical protein ACFXKG_05310 [Streptomyces sp. NPDC059255]|uniref:hypothetical protein n=1 Tax=Streptomyces sp. NPDC059255 TaxID=3346793 RepID=UPI0036BAC643
MTAVLQATLAEQQATMLREISKILATNPAGASLRLMVAPPEMQIRPDDVLVQEVNEASGIIELRPRSIADLHPADVIHDTQIINPADQDFIDYTPMASDCKYIPHPPSEAHAGKGHVYII